LQGRSKLPFRGRLLRAVLDTAVKFRLLDHRLAMIR
jgi:hypothetical protein